MIESRTILNIAIPANGDDDFAALSWLELQGGKLLTANAGCGANATGTATRPRFDCEPRVP